MGGSTVNVFAAIYRCVNMHRICDRICVNMIILQQSNLQTVSVELSQLFKTLQNTMWIPVAFPNTMWIPVALDL